MDRKGIEWKKFYDINFVVMTYQPFDAPDRDPFSLLIAWTSVTVRDGT